VQAEAEPIKTEAEIAALRRAEAEQAYPAHPLLLRELETMKERGRSANARIYSGQNQHVADRDNGETCRVKLKPLRPRRSRPGHDRSRAR
jgi:hypothetical protein